MGLSTSKDKENTNLGGFVMNLKSYRKNMNSVEVGGTIVLFSCSTPVAAFLPGKGVIRTKALFSTTTTRHINEWIKKEFSPNVTITAVEQSEIDSLKIVDDLADTVVSKGGEKMKVKENVTVIAPLKIQLQALQKNIANILIYAEGLEFGIVGAPLPTELLEEKLKQQDKLGNTPIIGVATQQIQHANQALDNAVLILIRIGNKLNLEIGESPEDETKQLQIKERK